MQSLANRSGAKTFGEWCDNFLKYIVSHFSSSCTRVDVVFDGYLDNSIKRRNQNEAQRRNQNEAQRRKAERDSKKCGEQRAEDWQMGKIYSS